MNVLINCQSHTFSSYWPTVCLLMCCLNIWQRLSTIKCRLARSERVVSILYCVQIIDWIKHDNNQVSLPGTNSLPCHCVVEWNLLSRIDPSWCYCGWQGLLLWTIVRWALPGTRRRCKKCEWYWHYGVPPSNHCHQAISHNWWDQAKAWE